MIPIILASAHELDTLNTVVKRCLAHISTFQTRAYCFYSGPSTLLSAATNVVCSEYQHELILRLGGLHISMNFLEAIGDHMDESGLAEVWVESGLLGRDTVELVRAGKEYNKGTRAHRLTLQALWRIMAPTLICLSMR